VPGSDSALLLRDVKPHGCQQLCGCPLARGVAEPAHEETDVRTIFRSRCAVLPALALALVTLTAACGSDDGDDDTSGAPSAGTSESVLGASNPATGAPVTFGYVSTGRTTTIDSTADIKAAEAAVKYVNEHLGGIGGRPMKLQVCEVTLDPAKASDCANQFVAAKVPAVLGGSTINGVDQLISGLGAAKIPLIVDVMSTPTAFKAPGVFILANALYANGAPASYAKTQNVKRVALIGLGVPTVIAAAEDPGRSFYTKIGAEFDIVGIAPGTADMTAQIQTEAAKNPGIYNIIGDPNFCLTALKGIQSLGLKTKITMIPNCVNAPNAASLTNGFEGMKVILTADLGGKEFQQFKTAMAQVSELPADGRSVGGWQAILAFERAMESAKVTDLTAANIQQGMTTMPATEFPLSGGQTFQCNGKAIPVAPTVCANFVLIADGDKAGNLLNFKPLESQGVY
jgi:branched-chain amino acid transport system substrate-binding protein